MRTTIFNLFVLVALMNLTSCSNEEMDKDLSPGSGPELTLTITVETPEDQMGEFADNAMAIFDGKVWSFGGENDYSGPGQYTSQLWNSTNGVHWATVPTTGLGAEGRHAHTLTAFNGSLYIIGGEDNVGNWLGDIWKSDDGMTWTNPFGLVPFGEIIGHQTIVYNSKMYVIAGDISTGNTKVYSTVDGNSWVEETNNAFPARVSHKAVVFNGAMYVIGGETIASTKLNEIWTSINGVNWTQVSTTGTIFSPRNGHTATVYNGKTWITGGRTSSGFGNDIWYSSNMIDWTNYEGFLIEDDLRQHTALHYNDALWLFGGYNDSGVTGQIVSVKED